MVHAYFCRLKVATNIPCVICWGYLFLHGSSIRWLSFNSRLQLTADCDGSIRLALRASAAVVPSSTRTLVLLVSAVGIAVCSSTESSPAVPQSSARSLAGWAPLGGPCRLLAEDHPPSGGGEYEGVASRLRMDAVHG
jgi:hypothetical protein